MTCRATGWASNASMRNALVQFRGHRCATCSRGSVEICRAPIHVPTTVIRREISSTLHRACKIMWARKLSPGRTIREVSSWAGFIVSRTTATTATSRAGITCSRPVHMARVKPEVRPPITTGMVFTEITATTRLNATASSAVRGREERQGLSLTGQFRVARYGPRQEKTAPVSRGDSGDGRCFEKLVRAGLRDQGYRPAATVAGEDGATASPSLAGCRQLERSRCQLKR